MFLVKQGVLLVVECTTEQGESELGSDMALNHGSTLILLTVTDKFSFMCSVMQRVQRRQNSCQEAYMMLSLRLF